MAWSPFSPFSFTFLLLLSDDSGGVVEGGGVVVVSMVDLGKKENKLFVQQVGEKEKERKKEKIMQLW